MLSTSENSSSLALAVVQKWRGLTPALAQQSAQVSALMKLSPELAGDAAEALGNLLAFTAAQFNIGKNLTDLQIAVLAGDMLERYWYWKFDEFAYVLREGVAARWGAAYDRIDGPVIHGWCQQYNKERAKLLEEEAQSRHRAERLSEVSKAEGQRGLESAEQYDKLRFISVLRSYPEQELLRGIAYYEQHPEQPHAATKLELAQQVLEERKQAGQKQREPELTDFQKAAKMEAIRQEWLATSAARRKLEEQVTGAEVLPEEGGGDE